MKSPFTNEQEAKIIEFVRTSGLLVSSFHIDKDNLKIVNIGFIRHSSDSNQDSYYQISVASDPFVGNKENRDSFSNYLKKKSFTFGAYENFVNKILGNDTRMIIWDVKNNKQYMGKKDHNDSDIMIGYDGKLYEVVPAHDYDISKTPVDTDRYVIKFVTDKELKELNR